MKHWKQTYSGVAYDLERPTPEMVVDVDVAHALSLICRFGGHSREFYSVAEHCVLGAQQLLRQHREASARLFLIHDAHEYVTGDLAGPAKPLIKGWREWEDDHERNLHVACDMYTTPAFRDIVKGMDNAMLKAEGKALLGPAPGTWAQEVVDAPDIDVKIQCWTPKEARYEYAKMAQKLGITVNGKPWTIPQDWVR